MIDFKAELDKILKEDPLELLKISTNKPITPDQRLIDSFREINNFIDLNGREPEESTDINERKLFSRLSALKKDFDKATILKDFDKHHLLENVKDIQTVEDILANDILGLIDDDPENIFNLKNIPLKKNKTDFVARRKPCKNFEKYENNFKQVQNEIRSGKRKLISFKESHLQENRYYILDGILSFLEKIEKDIIKEFNDKSQGKRKRRDPRIRCIFENGLESNMYLRSFQKELYNNGSTVIGTNEESLEIFNQNLGQITDTDKVTGYIYILSSLSEDPRIQNLKNLYKIGYCTTSVEERIKNADKDPTFLMAPVKIISTYKVFNLSPKKVEYIIHNFFKDRCLEIKVADNSRLNRNPKEWYVVPIGIIEQSIQLIINNEITKYRYDFDNNEIIKLF
jgi:hypothetical protein